MTNDESLCPPVNTLARSEVRRRLNQELNTEYELEAFILDYFEQTYRELTHAMNRTTKVNELLQRNSLTDIQAYLDKYIAERNSKPSLFKQIKKLGKRKLKKFYILISMLLGVTVEYIFGPVGKLLKILSLTSATAVTGTYVVITHTDLIPDRTVASLNSHLGTQLSTPTMRKPERKVVSSTRTIETNEAEFKKQIATLQTELANTKQSLRENNEQIMQQSTEVSKIKDLYRREIDQIKESQVNDIKNLHLSILKLSDLNNKFHDDDTKILKTLQVKQTKDDDRIDEIESFLSNLRTDIAILKKKQD